MESGVLGEEGVTWLHVNDQAEFEKFKIGDTAVFEGQRFRVVLMHSWPARLIWRIGFREVR